MQIQFNLSWSDFIFVYKWVHWVLTRCAPQSRYLRCSRGKHASSFNLNFHWTLERRRVTKLCRPAHNPCVFPPKSLVNLLHTSMESGFNRPKVNNRSKFGPALLETGSFGHLSPLTKTKNRSHVNASFSFSTLDLMFRVWFKNLTLDIWDITWCDGVTWWHDGQFKRRRAHLWNE